MLQFLSDPKLVLPTLVFINIWFGAPMIMVNVYAALQTVPQDQYEAALIDGASSWQSFIHITVPHIKVVVGLLVVLRTIWVFNNFDIIFMTTAGGPASMTTTMPLYIYDLGWTNKLVGRASAASIILLAFLIAVCLIYFCMLSHIGKREGSGMKKGRRFGDIVSNVYLILLSIVAVFPLLWLLVSAFKSSSEMLNNPTKIWPIQWTLANFKTVLFTLKFTVNIRNSLIIAGSTTVVAIIISSLAAYGVVRFFPKLGNVMTKSWSLPICSPPSCWSSRMPWSWPS